jgi:hypothetical protein
MLAVSISTLTFIGVLLFLRAFGQPLWSSEASGWAQAIGSVVTIAVTIALFKRQMREIAMQSRRDRALTLYERRRATHAIAIRGIELLEEMSNAYFIRDHVDSTYLYLNENFSAAAFSHVQEALAAVPHHDLGSYFLTAAILDIRDAIETARELGIEGRAALDSQSCGSKPTKNSRECRTFKSAPQDLLLLLWDELASTSRRLASRLSECAVKQRRRGRSGSLVRSRHRWGQRDVASPDSPRKGLSWCALTWHRRCGLSLALKFHHDKIPL